jgi:transposase-like protein
MVEDMLAARGIVVSHQAVRLWAEKFCIRNIKPNGGNRLILVLHG